MQYNGVPVDELYKAWKSIKDEEELRTEAGKIWDAKYREKHREERNKKSKGVLSQAKKTEDRIRPEPSRRRLKIFSPLKIYDT